MSELVDMPVVDLLPGQLWVGSGPAVLTTLLGSCVSVCLYAVGGVTGGMCHSVLPYHGGDCTGEGHRYVDCAIDIILSRMRRAGVRPGTIRAKLFGGADMFSISAGSAGGCSVGSKNIQAAKDVLAKERVTIVRESVGGTFGRKVIFYTATGEAVMKLVGPRETGVANNRKRVS